MSAAENGSILRALPEPCFLVSADSLIRSANPAAGRLLGRPAAELEGQRLENLVTDTPERVHRFLQLSASGGSPVPGSLTLVHSSKSSVACRAEASCLEAWNPERPALLFLRLRPRQPEADRFLLLNREIGRLNEEIRRRLLLEEERAHLVRSAREARKVAEQASALKDEFLAVVSHELRTPLNSLLIWTALLRDGRVERERFEEGLDAVYRAGHSLGDLISNLLAVSRLTAGKARLRARGVNFPDLVRDVINPARATAELKGVELAADLEVVGPVRGDPGRLRQVVWHLLSNAVKFTPSGGRVEVRLSSRDEMAELTVADTGSGIAPEHLPYVFDHFHRGDSPRTSRDRGLGLGLSLVRSLVDLHGGTVTAHSDGLGRGATFTVRLPFARSDPGEPPTGDSGASPDTEASRAVADGNEIADHDPETAS